VNALLSPDFSFINARFVWYIQFFVIVSILVTTLKSLMWSIWCTLSMNKTLIIIKNTNSNCSSRVLYFEVLHHAICYLRVKLLSHTSDLCSNILVFDKSPNLVCLVDLIVSVQHKFTMHITSLASIPYSNGLNIHNLSLVDTGPRMQNIFMVGSPVVKRRLTEH